MMHAFGKFTLNHLAVEGLGVFSPAFFYSFFFPHIVTGLVEPALDLSLCCPFYPDVFLLSLILGGRACPY